MADPLLDEEFILDNLKSPVSPTNCGELQTAAQYAMVAVYDRKCTRDEFGAALEATLGLHSQMGKLMMLVSIKDHFQQGKLNEDLIDRALDKAAVYASGSQSNLIEFVERLCQCPTSRDKVH